MGFDDIFASTFITLFVIIDPIGTLPIFAAVTAGGSVADCRRVAVRTVLYAGCIILSCAVCGEDLFALVGIGMPAFKVSGGLLLLLIAMQMLFQKERKERLDGPLTSSLPPEGDASSVLRPEPGEESPPELHGAERDEVEALSAASAKPTPAYTPIDPSVAVFPLAIPTLAGPGTLSTVIMVMGKAEDFDEKLIVMGVVVLVLAICLLCYLASHPIQRCIGRSGIKVLTALMGAQLDSGRCCHSRMLSMHVA